ncbi:MAG: porin [Nitrospinae bacterium]|nr:porin [Nitrospinota bacterium]
MRLIAALLILLIPSLSYGDSKDDRIRVLEEKVELLMPKTKDGKFFDAHGVKEQGTRNPYHHKKGFHFESQDGNFSTNLQWRAQMRFSSGNRSDPTEESDISGPRTVQDFELRRVRMKIGGHGYKYVKYYFEIDLQPSRSQSSSSANSSGRVIDWRIDVQPYEWFGFRVGQWKINYNRERVDSSGRQTFVERSIVNSVFTIDRQVGVLLKGRLNKGTAADFRYYAGIFNGEGRSVQNTSDSMMKMVRFQWNPLGRDLKWRQSDVKRHEKPTLSLAGAWAGNKSGCTRWSSSGCGNLDGLPRSDTNPDKYDINQYVAEVAYKHQGFALQSEYHWKIIGDAETLENHEMEGAYVSVGYFFNEVIPAIPEELELAFRYAYVDEPNSTRTIQENKRQEFTWGANYFIAGHGNKITADFSYLTLDDRRLDDRFDETRFRLQWDISF